MGLKSDQGIVHRAILFSVFCSLKSNVRQLVTDAGKTRLNSLYTLQISFVGIQYVSLLPD
jgi:hypothetical protein